MSEDMLNISFTAFWAALDCAMIANKQEPLLWSEVRQYWEHAKLAQMTVDDEAALNDPNYVGSRHHY